MATYPKNVWIGEPPSEPCPDHDCADDDPCGGEADPCTDAGFATIQIVDYTDGDIGGCEDCAEPDPFLPGTWNGVFARTGNEVPSFEWSESGCDGDQPACTWASCQVGEIDGKALSLGIVFLCPDSGTWHLIISCVEGSSFGPLPLWKGEKATGADPLGTYTRSGGCNSGPSSLEIEAGGSCPE